jgi:hypothetical protein
LYETPLFWLRLWGSDQTQEMILGVLCLFSVNYKFNQHLNLITTKDFLQKVTVFNSLIIKGSPSGAGGERFALSSGVAFVI